MGSKQPMKPSKHVTEARAAAQRAKLDNQAQSRRKAAEAAMTPKRTKGKQQHRNLLARRRARTTIEHAVADYLADHEGGNHSLKTLQWHQTALGLLRHFLEEERGITLVGEVDASDISAWFATMRKTPTGRGSIRSERTIQTYARSARAFFHWLVRREIIERNPFDRVVFPKVGKPLIRIIEPEEFEQLLLACTPPGEMGRLADRAATQRALEGTFHQRCKGHVPPVLLEHLQEQGIFCWGTGHDYPIDDEQTMGIAMLHHVPLNVWTFYQPQTIHHSL